MPLYLLTLRDFTAFFGASQKKLQIGSFSLWMAAYDGCMDICAFTSISVSCATSGFNALFSIVLNQCLGSNLPLAREPFGIDTGDLIAGRVVRPLLRWKKT